MGGSQAARPGRLVLLSGLAALLGLAGGVVGFAFVRATAMLLNLSLQHRFGWQFPSLNHLRAGWWLLPEALAGGAVVSVLAAWEPLIRGHGIPEAMEAVLVHQSRIGVRPAVAKPLASVIAIGTGAPFGAEGPIILTFPGPTTRPITRAAAWAARGRGQETSRSRSPTTASP